MSRFTITLPSNSSVDLHPDNKVSQWKMKLSEFVELQDKWEVGLLEVSFSRKVRNVYGNHFYFTVGGVAPVISCMLTVGTYDTIHSVLSEMQRAYSAAAKADGYKHDLVQFRYASRYRCVRIVFTEYPVGGILVYLSDDMATMTGFEPGRHYYYRTANDSKIYAKRPVLLTTSTTNVFVYCILLDHVMVGDVKALLLPIVNRTTAVLRIDDRVEHAAFNPVQYMPLQKKSFDMIASQLATNYKEPMPFVSGKAIVVLEFRRTVHPYLLL